MNNISDILEKHHGVENEFYMLCLERVQISRFLYFKGVPFDEANDIIKDLNERINLLRQGD